MRRLSKPKKERYKPQSLLRSGSSLSSVSLSQLPPALQFASEEGRERNRGNFLIFFFFFFFNSLHLKTLNTFLPFTLLRFLSFLLEPS
ncbi:hypothetical protein RIF29_16952 [Crotalaria pallida]|uniref:Uncharacterized protein n=1 Tax=Crotalaria pallida TaxID=3830 RepID=A0AAN9IE28_CROPI